MRRHLLGLALLFLASAACAAGDTPAHMELARSFFTDLKPENNYYINSVTGLRWKGDLFTSENVAKTDCSGFVTDILRRAHSDVPTTLSLRGGRRRPLAEDYYSNIVAQNGFARVDAINDVRIGDVIAWSYTRGTIGTGHVMFADSVPRKIKPYKPLVEGAEQWEIWVMDSTEGPHSRDDTRFRQDKHHATGVGRGRIRLYVDASGKIAGKANSFPSAKFSDESRAPTAIGRITK